MNFKNRLLYFSPKLLAQYFKRRTYRVDVIWLCDVKQRLHQHLVDIKLFSIRAHKKIVQFLNNFSKYNNYFGKKYTEYFTT